MKVIRVFVLSLLLVLMIAHQNHASSEKGTVILGQEGVSIQMNVHAGFEGHFMSSVPTPLWVEIHNGGENFLNGKLIVRTRLWIPPAIYKHDVNIAPGKTGKFKMYFYEEMSREISVVLKNNQNETILEKNAQLIGSSAERGIIVLCISESEDDFSFLDDASVPGYRSFNYAPKHLNTILHRDYNISQINVVRTIPPQMSEYLSSWDSICSVYCDLRSYLNLAPELKKHLIAWVSQGGELMLYPPKEDLSQIEIESLNADNLIPFKVDRKSTLNPEIHDSSKLTDWTKKSDFYEYTLNTSAIEYKSAGSSPPLISSIVYEWGGITLLGFHPDNLNPENLESLIEIFFQLGCLVPTPHRYRAEAEFFRIVSSRFSTGSHVPTKEERVSRGIAGIIIRILLVLIVPLLVILITGLLFFKFGRQMSFLYFVLPVMAFAAVFYPQFMVRENSFQIRTFEAYHVLQYSAVDNLADTYSTFILGKPYPPTGILNINCEDGYSTFDEIIGNLQRAHPLISVDCTPPGYLSTVEESPEEFRVFLSSMETEKAGGIDGVINVSEDGVISYKITNNTGMDLSNCEIYPYSFHIERTPLPRMLPDIPAGKTLEGIIEAPRDDTGLDNRKMDQFNYEIRGGILSYSARDEILFRLESYASGMAFKLNRPFYAYHNTALFYAFTKDFSRNLKVNGADLAGPEITLVLTHLNVTHENQIDRVRSEKIETLLNESPYTFKVYKDADVPNLEWMRIENE